MRIKPNPFKVVKVYLAFYLAASIVFYLAAGFTFPPLLAHYIVLGLFTILTIGFILFAIFNSYYEFGKGYLLHVNASKKMYYEFNSILYIDLEWSLKHKTLLFYTDKGHARYLPFDKNNVLIKTVVAKTNKLITKEEYKKRFPKTKM